MAKNSRTKPAKYNPCAALCHTTHHTGHSIVLFLLNYFTNKNCFFEQMKQNGDADGEKKKISGKIFKRRPKTV